MLARDWHVTVREIRTTPTSLLAFGEKDGAPVVLKVVAPHGDEGRSGRVAEAFAGRGMVRVLERSGGAALLERLRPGVRLSDWLLDSGDVEATRIMATVLARMWSVEPPTCDAPSAERWGAGFSRYLTSGDRRIPVRLVEQARDRYMQLCETQSGVRLLHGDLQHTNILRDAGRGWLAIDPKGVVAEREFELGATLRNPPGVPRLYSRQNAERRVRQLVDALGVDGDRALDWAFAQAVLSAIWTLEDEGRLDDAGPALALVESLRKRSA